MKEKKNLKLTLEKQTISRLNNLQASKIQGGNTEAGASDCTCSVPGGLCSPSDEYLSCAVRCQGDTNYYPKCTQEII